MRLPRRLPALVALLLLAFGGPLAQASTSAPLPLRGPCHWELVLGDGPNATIETRLQAPALNLGGRAASLDASARLALEDGTLALQAREACLAPAEAPPAQLRASGSLRAGKTPGAAAATLDSLTILAGSDTVFSGEATAAWSAAGVGPDLRLRGSAPNLARAAALAACLFPDASPAGAEVSGAADIRFLADAGATRLELDAAPPGVDLALPGLPKLKSVSGRATFSGAPGGAWNASAKLLLRLPALPTSPALGLDLDLSGETGRTALRLARLSAGTATLASGSGELVADASRARRGELRLVLAKAGALRVELAQPPEGGLAGLTGTAAAQGLDLAGLAETVARAGLSELQAWGPRGEADVRAALIPGADGPRLDVRTSVVKGGFASPDAASLADKLEAGARLGATLGDRPQLSFELSATRGELLIGSAYRDLGERPSQLSGSATQTGPGRWRVDKFEAAGKGLGRAAASGELRLPRAAEDTIAFSARISLPEANLGPLFQTFARDRMALALPRAAGWTAQGSASGRADIRSHGGALSLTGELTLKNAGLAAKDGPLVADLNLSLPFDYRFGGQPTAPLSGAETRSGVLSAGALRFGAFEARIPPTPVSLWGNTLAIHDRMSGTFLGGGLSLSRVLLRNPLSGDVSGRFRAWVRSLDLAQVQGLPFGLRGRLHADFPVVSVSDKAVRPQGQCGGSFFDGKLTVRNIEIAEPFSLQRRLRADVSIAGLNLESFSESLGAGRITGRLDLDLTGLEIAANGEPLAFRLEARSVPTKGVGQEISLKAVNAISLMSTGASLSSASMSVFTSIFSTFSYESIGLACALRNDVFRVRGLIKEGGIEYLVKKPTLFGINVVNANPENVISFSDMLTRFERATHTDEIRVDTDGT